MFDPTVGRWFEEDPIGLDVEPNLYEYVGNSPTNATDPSGLFGIQPQPDPKKDEKAANPPVLTAGNAPMGFEKDAKVAEFFPLAFDLLGSGSTNAAIRDDLCSLVWMKSTFLSLMEKHCEDKNGKGWTVTPVELRITGIKFAPESKGVLDVGPPRRTQLVTYVMTKDGLQKVRSEEMSKDKYPVAHFEVDGYWIFKCSKGGKDIYQAIKLDYVARTTAHSPYDTTFAALYSKQKQKYADDKSAFYGPVADNNFTGVEWFEGKKGEAIKAMAGLLKIVPGGGLDDYKPKKIDVDVVSLKVLLERYEADAPILQVLKNLKK